MSFEQKIIIHAETSGGKVYLAIFLKKVKVQLLIEDI